MRAVYLLRSLSHPERTYVGSTFDPSNRLADHNAGRSPHMSRYAPWQLVAAIQVTDEHKANAFERYLKSGSGRAFANRHFWSAALDRAPLSRHPPTGTDAVNDLYSSPNEAAGLDARRNRLLGGLLKLQTAR